MSSRNAIYARYSSHNQDGGTSIAVQIARCLEIAGAGAAQYIDRAVTGTTMSREAFDRMLVAAEAGKIDTVYVYKFDRFGRSAYAHAVIADLEAIGVRVVSATEGDDPLSRDIQLVVATDFSRRQSARIRDAKQQAFREGRWHGGTVPYGYAADGNQLTVDPGESEWVAELFERYLNQAMGFRDLARWLEDRGLPTRRSRHWSADSVKSILMNPMYCGRVYFGVYRSQANRTRAHAKMGEAPMRIDESLRIVGEDLWDKVQAKIGRRRTRKPAGRSQCRAFTRAITCSCCESSLVRRYYQSGKNYTTGTEAYWGCGTRMKKGARYCDNAAKIDEEWLLEQITESMAGIFEEAETMVDAAVELAVRELRGSDDDADRLEANIADVDRRIEHATRLLMDPDLDQPAARRQLADQIEAFSADRESMAGRLDHVRSRGLDRASMRAGIEEDLAAARRSFGAVMSAEPADFNQFVTDWLSPMVLAEDGTLIMPDDSESGQKHFPPGETPKPCTAREMIRGLLRLSLAA